MLYSFHFKRIDNPIDYSTAIGGTNPIDYATAIGTTNPTDLIIYVIYVLQNFKFNSYSIDLFTR